MVDGQADIAHWPHNHDVLAINFPYFDALFNLSDTQNGRLRLIDDDGCGNQATGDAVVGYGESAVADIFRFELVVTCPCDQVG